MNVSEALPNELWLQSLGYLSKTDLKALRLSMEPHLGSLASSLLFTTAYIAARKGVLDTFTNLTTHPVFRAYVKEIVFDSSWIDPTTVAEFDNDENELALACFFQEQEGIQANELQSRLETAFQCLSKVKTVSYADLSRLSCLPGDCNDPSWDSDYSDGPLIRRLESDRGPNEIGICCLMHGTNAKCPAHGDNFRRRFGGLILLLKVLSDYAATTLEDLSLGSRVHACKDGGIPDWFLLLNTNYFLLANTEIATFHEFSNIFFGLRKFELTVSTFTLASVMSSPQLYSLFDGEGLAGLLGLAKNLEEIKLTSDPKAAKLSVTRILANHRWARLRVLYLNGFEASASELEDFLKRHTLSLQRVTLDEFNLTSYSWLDLGINITPRLEFILGLVWAQNRPFEAEKYLPLSYLLDLDVSGPSQDWYDKARGDDDAESQVENDDEDASEDASGNESEDQSEDENDDEYDDESEDESEDGSNSEELDYSSDDSSPETEEPRRKPDVDLLETIDADLRSEVEQLRSKLPGCPVQECLKALTECKKQEQSSIEVTAALLMRRFGYTELETVDPETRASLEIYCRRFGW